LKLGLLRVQDQPIGIYCSGTSRQRFVSELANYIDQFGYEVYFYEIKLIYFKHNELTYWHMGNIINRCMEKDTYRYRKAAGNLPKK